MTKFNQASLCMSSSCIDALHIDKVKLRMEMGNVSKDNNPTIEQTTAEGNQ